VKIALIGTGNVGSVLGQRWAEKGHQVIFGTREPGSDKIQALLAATGANSSALSAPEAVAAAEVVVLATPWSAVQPTAEAIADWDGKTLIDCTNPIGPGLQLVVGGATSGAEQIATWAKGAKVVKAFNTTGAENMANPIYDSQPLTMFICGDDGQAKAIARGLAEDLGFEVVDVGALALARYLEPLAMVWIHLAMVQKLGRNIGLKLVKRS
jgi:hypothetical protein